MITTGIIREVAVNKGNFIGNAYKVELNIFQIPGDNDKKNYTYTANCIVPGGVYDSFNVGDKVFVGFLNNNKSLPLILGKIYQGVKDEARSIANLNALKVKSKAELPKNTTIGDIDFSDKEYFFDNVNEVIQDKDIFVDSIQLKTDNEGAGRITFDNFEGVAQISLSPNVTMALGVDTVLKVYNDTNDTLVDGTVVYRSGNINDTTKVQPAIANNHTISNNTIGVITEPIASNDYGFISRQGYVGGLLLDPAVYATDQILYLSPSVPGTFTNQKPVAPNFITQIGYVYKVSSDASTYDGQIYVDIIIIPISSDISYNNANAHLDSQTVKGAIDELSLKKADISMLTSNISLFRTLVDSDISGYKKLVTSVHDTDFPTTATPVSSGAITTANQYIAGTVSLEGLFVGNPGQINVYSYGRVRKLSGNKNQNAEFFFRMYRRESNGTEHLVATSGSTATVTDKTWASFDASALLDNGEWGPTDRVVVKSYANYVGNPGGVFEYEFGGTENPFRIIIPVPVNVIPTPKAIGIITDISQFNTILSSDDTNVQHALETLDNHTHALPVASDTVLGAIKIGDGLNVELDGTVSVDTLAANGVKITVSDSESPPPLETLGDGDFWYEY